MFKQITANTFVNEEVDDNISFIDIQSEKVYFTDVDAINKRIAELLEEKENEKDPYKFKSITATIESLKKQYLSESFNGRFRALIYKTGMYALSVFGGGYIDNNVPSDVTKDKDKPEFSNDFIYRYCVEFITTDEENRNTGFIFESYSEALYYIEDLYEVKRIK